MIDVLPLMKDTKAHDGQWYEIRPFTNIEYKQPADLVRMSYDFVFLVHKGAYNMEIFMKGVSLSSASFETRSLPEHKLQWLLESLPLSTKYHYECYLRDVLPVASDPATFRDRLYEELAAPAVRNTAIIVSAQRLIGGYWPLTKSLRRAATSTTGARSPERPQQEWQRRMVVAKSAEALYLTKIFIATDDPANAVAVRSALPGDQTAFRMRVVSAEKVAAAALNRPLDRPAMPSWAGFFANVFFKRPIVRDTVLNRTELVNLVHLPSKPARFSITPGQLADVSQGFDLADLPPESEDYETGQ